MVATVNLANRGASPTRLAPRAPAWSNALTVPLARRISARSRPAALLAIKALHTLIFASVTAALVLFSWDGIRQRPGRRASAALAVVLAETAVFASNNQVCPCTPLAEDIGATTGSVADIFLPGWLSRRIPIVGGAALLIGLAFHAYAFAMRTWRRPSPHHLTSHWRNLR